MLEVGYSNQTSKFLKKIDKVLLKRLLEKIEELKERPFLHDTKIIKGYEEKIYRVRIGDYRILYEVDHKNNTLGIVKIDKRSKVYD